MYNIPNFRTKQQLHKKFVRNHNHWQNKRIFLPEKEVTLSLLISSFENNTFLRNDIFNILIWYCDKFKTVYVTQSKIAKHAKCSPKTVNRLFKLWTELGYMDKMYRVKRSCLYRLSIIFYNPTVRQRLSHLLPAFKNVIMLCFLLLCSTALADQKHSNKQIVHQPLWEYDIYIKIMNDIHNLEDTDYRRGRFFYYENVEFGIKSGGRSVPHIKKEKMGMMIPDYIKNIKSIELTLQGECALSIFSREAIQYADAFLCKLTKSVTNPFRYLFKCAENYSSGKRIAINYGLGYTLREVFNVDENTPFYVTGSEARRLEKKGKYLQRQVACIPSTSTVTVARSANVLPTSIQTPYKPKRSKIDYVLLEKKDKEREARNKKIREENQWTIGLTEDEIKAECMKRLFASLSPLALNHYYIPRKGE